MNRLQTGCDKHQRRAAMKHVFKPSSRDRLQLFDNADSPATKEKKMKRNLIALASAAFLMTGDYSAQAQDAHLVQAQDRYVRDRHERRHERRELHQGDVISMLEGHGYRIRDVKLERGRFSVRASRRGERLLVIVSRYGEILETRRITTDRF
ncbi:MULTISPECIES: hypothetical protein [Agrobacterium]|uniref:hypothetical protein n=1 Tax=Agrobacterium tumefaciens TaxID=358 RepID=UPI0015740F83|nr:hypothetical protein [Agrobacterium tumefaciens]MDR5012106.1 hypothetical protein [Agrobacterium tumefaciens]NTA45446.1 hypothetical protein [Agrobacterium tumefaciens]WIE36095.1 hypothetical protein G6L82_023630 [Agrobacterium tumefaciens]